jgi:Flp pilus assembly protein TadG
MKRTWKRAAGTLRRFARDARANTAIIFAISAVPMMLVVGAAYDFSRAATLEGRLQASLDAGALAAAASADLSDGERKDLARAVFKENFAAKAGKDVDAEPKVTIDSDKVTMSVSLDYPTSFMRIAGITSMMVDGEVEVAIPDNKKAEIALVLDYSGSMTETSGGKVKYVAMREAAIKLVDDLTQDGKSDKVKFGLVPFSHHVYASLPGEHVLGGTAGKTWSGCTQDRKYPYNLTDATPLAGNDDTKWGQKNAAVHASAGCEGYLPRNLVVKPISDDHAAVKRQLRIMKPYQWTHIALGFEFGWHLLSPNAPFGGTVPYNDKETMKVLVLLTDGRQTEPAFGPGSIRNVAQGEKNLETLCANAKAKGVTVITVAFDLRHQATENRLRDCSSDPAKFFFIAEDDDQLAAAFDQIKAQLASAIHIAK